MRVVAYTDGSSRGNPGPGGYGVVLLYTDPSGVLHTKELSGGFHKTTNNRMEIMGAIAALEALKRPCEVELHSDSQYLVNAMNKHWIDGWQSHGWKTSAKKPVKNPDLWKRLVAATQPHRVQFVWVKGHAGHQYNERCDQLATAAADDRAHQLVDEGFMRG
ncbi:MAG: ribonuclease HI [Atopobiaceae bacterium]